MTEAADQPVSAYRRIRSWGGRVLRAAGVLAPLPVPPPPPREHILFVNHMCEAYRAPPQAIQAEVSAEELQALFARTRAQWMALGDTEPYWSVLTSDDFRSERFDSETSERFYETGRESADLLDIFEARSAVTLRRGVCLELGCGVGRITGFLAERFERVVAVDISAGNLRICQAHMARLGRTNVEFVLLRDVAAVADLPDFDVLFSFIVLQHNSPPIAAYMLDTLLGKIRAGGGCLFQIPTNPVGYTFAVADYLSAPPPEMEMHALPQPLLLRLLHAHGLQLREIAADPWTGSHGSQTVFASKA